MLKHLRVRNFKGWQDTTAIRMAPITLFFGANSSGKSSIGQFLMMLKQTVESPDRKAVFYPGGKNSAVQLGSYKDMVFRHDTKNNISFEYSWELGYKVNINLNLSESGSPLRGETLFFEADVGADNKDQYSLILNHLRYRFTEEKKQTLSVGLKRKSKETNEYKTDLGDYIIKRIQGLKPQTDTLTPIRFYGLPFELVACNESLYFASQFNLWHEIFFRSFCYLGPLRTRADRLYLWTGIGPESVGYRGENTVAAILAARQRKISLGSDTKPFEEMIALELKKMGLIEAFRVSAISPHRQEYEVKIRTKGSPDWVDIPDAGFGISQVLPVLVQCFYAPPGSIIIMEQPEIHLHPSAQAALADVMMDAIKSRENGKDRNIQLIIETHSEHFLRRLQRRIAEDVLSEESVSAYFADMSKTPATLKTLQLDSFGNIHNWPENFFGDEMGDITGQAKAALEKRIRQNKVGQNRHDR